MFNTEQQTTTTITSTDESKESVDYYFLHLETKTAQKVLEVITKGENIFYRVECHNKKQFIIRAKDIGKTYYKPLDVQGIKKNQFFINHPDCKLHFTPILKTSTKCVEDLTTLIALYETNEGTFFIDSKGTVLNRSDFCLPKSGSGPAPEPESDPCPKETYTEPKDIHFLFWEPNEGITYSYKDWKVECKFESGALIMVNPLTVAKILVIPGYNLCRRSDLQELDIPTTHLGASVTCRVDNSYSNTDIIDIESSFFKFGSNNGEMWIYIPTQRCFLMNGGKVFRQNHLKLYAKPFALFSYDAHSTTDCWVARLETQRVIMDSARGWSEPRRDVPVDGFRTRPYFREWIEWTVPVIWHSYDGEFKLIVAKTQDGHFIVRAGKFLNLVDLYESSYYVNIYSDKSITNLYVCVKKVYGELHIGKPYRVSIAGSNELELVEFSAFANRDGITYGFTLDNRVIKMCEVEAF